LKQLAVELEPRARERRTGQADVLAEPGRALATRSGLLEDGERTLREEDIIVVAPYNAQVRCLRRAIPDRAIRIGTAKCLAYLVAAPRLLDASCKTIEQMRIANALCLFVEEARA